MSDRRPTIAELEAILSDPNPGRVEIQPNGEIRVVPNAPAKWIAIAEHGPPEPEVFVLCWDGQKSFVDWFGSKPDAGRGVTHWIPYEMPPGATSDMHDGRRAFRDSGSGPQGENSRSEVEGEAPQSGRSEAKASPND